MKRTDFIFASEIVKRKGRLAKNSCGGGGKQSVIITIPKQREAREFGAQCYFGTLAG